MPVSLNYKPLSSMTAEELRRVDKYCALHARYFDDDTNYSIKSDIKKNWARLDSNSCAEVYDILKTTLEQILAQKTNLALIFIPMFFLYLSAWLQITLSLACIVSLIIVMHLGLVFLRIGINVQNELMKCCAPTPKLRYSTQGTDFLYDANIDSNPGQKIFSSLTYRENLFLMFGRYKLITPDKKMTATSFTLEDNENNIVQTWDMRGNLV